MTNEERESLDNFRADCSIALNYMQNKVSKYGKNKLDLTFKFRPTPENKKIVDEVIEQSKKIADEFKTELTFEFISIDDDCIDMEMRNNITKNEHLTDEFFKFFDKFLKYTNEVEADYCNFATISKD